jgi:hypothetical protein
MSIQTSLDTIVNLPVVSENAQLNDGGGPSTFTIQDMTFVCNTEVVYPSYVATAIAAEPVFIYSVQFLPDLHGLWHIFIGGNLIHTIEVVDPLNSRDYVALLTREIHNESIGSWQWDKVTGELTLFAVNGQEFKKYNIVDTAAESSRELIQEN